MFLVPDDLSPFAEIPAAKAAAMIEDAEAQAAVVAPCITDLLDADPKRGAVKAILRRAVLRWHDAGSGALSSQQMGPFSQSVDTRQPQRGMFWPSEIEQLQGICSTSSSAFTIDMTGGSPLPANPLYGATINAYVGEEPMGEWSPEVLP